MIQTLQREPGTTPPRRSIGAEMSLRDGWWIHLLDEVNSTNTVAAELPVWNAVRARSQTAGRGRTGRHWVSNRGGLWLSAVLPCPADEPIWQFLPLATGWALAHALAELDVSGLRLRWPNDLMIGGRKLAGILAERFRPDSVVIGVGINVLNTPETLDSQLAGYTARLSDLTGKVRSLGELSVQLLAAIRLGHETLRQEGFAGIAADLNANWTEPRMVELTLAGRDSPLRGRFAGIDERGALRLRPASGGENAYDATQVALLREVDERQDSRL